MSFKIEWCIYIHSRDTHCITCPLFLCLARPLHHWWNHPWRHRTAPVWRTCWDSLVRCCRCGELWKHQKNNPKRMLSQKHMTYKCIAFGIGIRVLCVRRNPIHRYTLRTPIHQYKWPPNISNKEVDSKTKHWFKVSWIFHDFVWTLTVPISSFDWITWGIEASLLSPCYYNAQAAPIVLSF